MAIVKRNKATIFGLPEELTQLAAAIAQETSVRQTQVGDMTQLPDFTSLVEAYLYLSALGEETQENGLKKEANLNDLENKEEARAALLVLSESEVDERIEEAKIALGTNFTVDDIAERDALEDMDLQDRVFVRDTGDGTWGQFKPILIDPDTGAVTEWLTLMTESILQSVMSAPAIKAAYESNDDTNALSDANLAKLEGIDDVTDLLRAGELVQDLNESLSEVNPPSAKAVRDYTAVQVSQGGALPRIERVTVEGDLITLENEPRYGINGIMNFACVRYTDAQGSAYDAPVLPTEDGKVFRVAADTEGQWDGNDVVIQYLYTPGGVNSSEPPPTELDEEPSEEPDAPEEPVIDPA